MTNPNDFLLGGGIASATFKTVGTSHSGTICEQPTVQQQRDLATGKAKFWDDGNPMNQLVVTVQTTERGSADDDGKRRFYIKAQMRQAVADAVRKSGAQGLEIGGVLTVTYTGDGVQETRGFNPPKNYSASYVAPAVTATTEFLGTTEPAAPAYAPTAVASPAAKPQFSPEQLAAMQQAGVDISKLVSA